MKLIYSVWLLSIVSITFSRYHDVHIDTGSLIYSKSCWPFRDICLTPVATLVCRSDVGLSAIPYYRFPCLQEPEYVNAEEHEYRAIRLLEATCVPAELYWSHFNRAESISVFTKYEDEDTTQITMQKEEAVTDLRLVPHKDDFYVSVHASEFWEKGQSGKKVFILAYEQLTRYLIRINKGKSLSHSLDWGLENSFIESPGSDSNSPSVIQYDDGAVIVYLYPITDNCEICLDDYETTEDITITECGHMYHVECLWMWVKKKANVRFVDTSCQLCQFNKHIDPNMIIIL